MYVKIDTSNNIVKYPYFITDLILENPEISWPSVLSDELLSSFNIKRVVETDRPSGYVAEELPPVFIDNLWVQQWTLREPTEAETATKADVVRLERNPKLLASDWIVARSYEQGVPVPPAWVEYRQALRDITNQPGFPWTITWPTL